MSKTLVMTDQEWLQLQGQLAGYEAARERYSKAHEEWELNDGMEPDRQVYYDRDDSAVELADWLSAAVGGWVS